MGKVHNTLRLMGYKINEMSNGDFIGKRPNGKQSLFNSKCELMLEGMAKILQISKDLYIGEKKDKLILFNREGQILDTVPNDYKWRDYLTPGSFTSKHISFRLSGDAEDYDCIENVYSLDGKIQFKDLPTGYVEEIITQDGKTKLVCYYNERKGSVIEIIDTQGKNTKLDIGYSEFRSVNDNFILLYENNKNTIIDFKGNVMFTGDRLFIDKINSDNDTVLTIDRNIIEIYVMNEAYYTEYKTNREIHELEFTTNKDIIYVEEVSSHHTGYLLNIRTKKRTAPEFDIIQLIGDIALVKTTDYRTSVCKLNLDTFELTEVFTCDYCNCNTENIIVYKDGREQYYNLDLEPLLHEI